MKKITISKILIVPALTLFGITIAQAQVHDYSPTSVNSVPAQSPDPATLQTAIQIQHEKIKALHNQLRSLHDQLYHLSEEMPQKPQRQYFDDDNAYQHAVSRYQAEMARWQSRVDSVRQKITKVKEQLAGKEAKLVALLSKQAQQSETIKVQPLKRELFVFDPAVDDDLADLILKREAELSDVQTRGGVVAGSRTRILAPLDGSFRTSVSGFRKQTAAVGLKDAVAHVEAVGLGARPNSELVATAILQSVQSHPQHDVQAILFMVFRESIQQTNADKRYWLGRLQDMNKISEALGDYLKQLNDGLTSGQGCNDDSGPQDADLRVLDPDHRMLAEQIVKERAWLNGVDGIKRTIRQLQQMEGQVRQRRGVISTQFENANQKSTQYTNMLSSVLKTMKEMESGVIRNLR